jgi:uncharacterized protein YfiM (DUF2279 family)
MGHRNLYLLLLVSVLLVNILPAQNISICSLKNHSFFIAGIQKTNLVSRSDGFSGFFKPDKAQHFIGSAISTIFLTKFSFTQWNLAQPESKKFAAMTTIGLGLFKEIMDKNRPHNFFSWKDLCADGMGIIIGIILVNQP